MGPFQNRRMHVISRIVGFAILVLFPFFVQAQTLCTVWKPQSPATGLVGGPFATSGEACNWTVSEYNGAVSTNNSVTLQSCTDTQANVKNASGATQYFTLGINFNQPCVAPPDPNAACAADLGKTSLVNVTVGYTRSSDDNDFATVGPITTTPPGSNLCVAGCSVTTQSATPSTPGVAAYRSQVPNAQGLYRMSLDLPVTNSGVSCAGVPADVQSATVPTTPDVPCPGFVGDVNGKKGCFGTAEKPVITKTADRPPVAESRGNPMAGAVPTSGEGSGEAGSTARTPLAGSGGSAGGPAAAAAGAPTGTASSPAAGTEQLNCGAPGQPRCRIDESGTPAEWPSDKLKQYADKYKTDVDAARATVSGSGDKGFFSNWGQVFFAPPIAQCVPFDLPRNMGSLDPCPVAEGMRSVMAWIWAVGGLILVVGMVRKVV